MIRELECLGELRRIEAEINKESERLHKIFGKRFVGIETPWNHVLEAVQWASRFRVHMGLRQFPEALLDIVVAGKKKKTQNESPTPDIKIVRECLIRVLVMVSRMFCLHV